MTPDDTERRSQLYSRSAKCSVRRGISVVAMVAAGSGRSFLWDRKISVTGSFVCSGCILAGFECKGDFRDQDYC